MLADGTIIDCLKTVRKDNTGYDLKQLFHRVGRHAWCDQMLEHTAVWQRRSAVSIERRSSFGQLPHKQSVALEKRISCRSNIRTSASHSLTRHAFVPAHLYQRVCATHRAGIITKCAIRCPARMPHVLTSFMAVPTFEDSSAGT